MNITDPTIAALSVCLVGAGVTAHADCIDDICFTDRGLSGEIDLGFLRGAIAVIDYDGDGFMDLVIGDRAGSMNKLFHNEAAADGSRTFVDVTTGSGIDDADNTDRGADGIVTADYDNDGDADIYITGHRNVNDSHGVLYRNDGGTFTNVSVAAGVRTTGYDPVSASWNDYDLDGHVDLLVGAWQGGTSNLLLWHNQGDGTFVDASDLLPVVNFRTVYSQLWMDYDDDGYADCFILSDSGDDVLLKNVDDGQDGRTFVNTAVAAGYTGLGTFPMGIAAGDFDNDGDFDLGVSNASAGAYYENVGGAFVKIFPFTGIFGWGVAWLDVDNDADLDFSMAGSWGGPGANFDKVFRNLGGGAFDDISTVLNGVSASSRYSVQIDFNNDGRQDLVTVNPGSPGLFISVYENTSTTPGNWITLDLAGDGSKINRSAIGAVVRLTAGGVTQVRQVVSGSSTTATEDLRVHFGLGEAAIVDEVSVIWPTGGSVLERTDVYAGPLPVNAISTLQPRLEDRPDSFVVVFGSYVSGGAEAMFFSDDDYLIVQQRAALSPLLPLIRLEIGAEACHETASELRVTVETATTAIPTQPLQKLSLFDYDGGTWTSVDERIATPGDSVVEVTIDTNAGRFIEAGTRAMGMRLEYFDPGAVFFPAWGVRVDHAVWVVTP